MTRLDGLYTRPAARRHSHASASAPEGSHPLAFLGIFATVLASIGATGFTNPGEQIRVWTAWLAVINVVMAVALTLAVIAVLR